MPKLFQRRFHESVLPNLINILKDEVPRVVAHGFAALTNFLECCPKEGVMPHVQTLLEYCYQGLENGCSIVKENSMSVLASLSEVCKKDFMPYWQKTAEIVFNILKNATGKEYKQLRGQSIETLTLIGDSVGKDEFRKAADEIIRTMIYLQQNHLEESDPQKAYLLSGWQRIVRILQADFAVYLDTILPPIYKLVDDVIENDRKRRKKEQEEEESEFDGVQQLLNKDKQPKQALKTTYNTAESEEVILAVDMITAFADELEGHYFPYVEKTSEIVLGLLDYDTNEDVRYTAGKALAILVKCVKKSTSQDALRITHDLTIKFINSLWVTIEQELVADRIGDLVGCIKECIKAAGRIFANHELEDMNAQIFRGLQASDERKTENRKYAQDEELEEDDHEAIEEENKQEEDLHCCYAELIGALFATHKEETIPLAKMIYRDILPKVLEENQSPKIHKFGLFLIDDMIEHLGVELIPDEWPHLAEALTKFASSPAPEVRQPAAFGISVLAQRSSDIFREKSNFYLEVLYNALHVKQRESDTDKSYGYAKDNVIAAVGNIIKCQAQNLPEVDKLIGFWVECLPLRYDKEEARVQHELLVDIILQSNANWVFGESGERMKHVIKIFAETVNTKFSTETIREKIVKVIQALLQNEASAKLAQEAVAELETKLQNKLKEILA